MTSLYQFILSFTLLFFLTFQSIGQNLQLELEAKDNVDLQLKFSSNNLSESNTIGTLNDGDLVFRSDGVFGETMRILDENGFIGIGRATPISRVDIEGSLTLNLPPISAKERTFSSRTNNKTLKAAGLNGTCLQFNGENGVLSSLAYDGLDTRLSNSEAGLDGGWLVLTANGGLSADVIIQAQNDIRFETGPLFTQQMTITETGQVGIGTTTPTTELDVVGGIKVGTTTSAIDGTIRYDGTNLQAHIGGTWQNVCVGNCTPVDCNNFNITFPPANQNFSQDFSINGSNQVIINITFNTAVNPATVVSGSTLIVQSGGTTVPGTISWNGSNTVATFITNADFFSFCIFSPDCFMNLQLIGTNAGNGTIEDANGCTLDGDGNGTQGGNYSTTFGILG